MRRARNGVSLAEQANQDYTRKLAAAYAQAQAAGMARWQYDDGLDRFARKVGLRLRPAPYRHLGMMWVRWFAFFAISVGNLVWSIWWYDWSTSRLAITTASVAAGLALLAVLLRKANRRKHRLTPWSAL